MGSGSWESTHMQPLCCSLQHTGKVRPKVCNVGTARPNLGKDTGYVTCPGPQGVSSRAENQSQLSGGLVWCWCMRPLLSPFPASALLQVLRYCCSSPRTIEVLINSYDRVRVTDEWAEAVPAEIMQVREPRAFRDLGLPPTVSVWPGRSQKHPLRV